MTDPPEDAGVADIRKWLTVRVQTLASELNRQMTAMLRDHFGLTLPEWRVIAHLGNRDSASVQMLAALTGMDKAQTSRTITSLTLSSTITRENDPSDGRAILLRLTDKGRALFAEIQPISAARRDWLKTLADKDDLQTFLRVADLLIDGMQDAPEMIPPDRSPNGTA